MEQTFVNIFNTILTGNKEESKKAAREVRKFLYSTRHKVNSFKEIESIIETAPEKYAKISEDWRCENFAISVSVIYYLHTKEKSPDFLFSWLFQLLQHKNGNIRQAAVRMFAGELDYLISCLRYSGVDFSDGRLLPEEASIILRGLDVNLSNLAERFWKTKYEKIKYVDSLPSGRFKSIQMILSRLDEYIDELNCVGHIRMKAGENILQKRAEIEEDLSEMLKGAGGYFTFDHIRDVIYYEEDNDDVRKIIAMLDSGGGSSELGNIIELVTDAWNYFPHKSLGGISPAEKLEEYNSKNSGKGK